MNMSMGYVYSNFSALYPNVTVTLRGGGNDPGFAHWIAGESVINQASRKISAAERQQAEGRGINVTETKVGVESVAVIADPRSGVTELSFDQLRGLFNGSIDNWKQVGGADQAVQVFIPRPEGSPYLFFNKSVMGTSSYAPSTITIDDGKELVNRVANSSGAVGFVRSGFVNGSAGVTSIPISSASGGSAYAGTDLDAAYNGSYPLARYYYLYTNGSISGAQGAWASFILDPEHGQRILAENGFLPLRGPEWMNSTANLAAFDDAMTGYHIVRTSSDGSTAEFNVSSARYVDSNVTTGTYIYTVSAVYVTGLGEAPPITVTMPEGGGTETSAPAYFGISAWTLAAVGLGAAVVAVAVAVLVKRR
jgi:phosphate transport system substrate-binding protein